VTGLARCREGVSRDLCRDIVKDAAWQQWNDATNKVHPYGPQAAPQRNRVANVCSFAILFKGGKENKAV